MHDNLIEFRPDPPRDPLPQALGHAAALAQDLHGQGIEIHSAFDNGRRMVLLIASAPAGVSGTMKKRHPNGRGGITTLFAAVHSGCQLEWTVDTVGDREVRHG